METLKVRQAIRNKKAQSSGAARRAEPPGITRATSSRARSFSAAQEKASKLRELGAKRHEAERRKEKEQEVRSLREAAAERDENDEDAIGSHQERRHGSGDGTPSPHVGSREQNNAQQAIEPRADPQQLERIRLTRSRLEKWIVEPFFDKVVCGCFVRIGIGKNDDRPIYRVAEIVSVKDGFRPYTMGENTTTKRLELRIGDSRKFFQMSFVSNQNFELSELQKYEVQDERDNVPPKTMRQVEEKVTQLKEAKEYSYSNEEVQKMVEEQARSRLRARGSLASRKKRLELQKEAAAEDEKVEGLQEDDVVKLRERQRLLDEDMQKLMEKEALQKEVEERREATSFRIKDINMRNQAYQRKVGEEAASRQEAESKGGEFKATDPFKRIEGRHTNYWTVKGPNKSEAPSALALAAAPAAAPAVAPAAAPAELTVIVGDVKGSSSAVSPGFKELVTTPRETGTELSTPRSAEAAESALGGFSQPDPLEQAGERRQKLPLLAGKRAEAHKHTLDIVIDIESPTARPVARPRPSVGASQAPSSAGSAKSSSKRPTLSINDYKRRAGIV
mmetsp:Transcript_52103/g.86375  ORF Transcript_52103/g.86375 Transcript_52103/m.86375 type:complete len:562 (-) Transcript_52103:524-2209(-)